MGFVIKKIYKPFRLLKFIEFLVDPRAGALFVLPIKQRLC